MRCYSNIEHTTMRTKGVKRVLAEGVKRVLAQTCTERVI